MASVIAFVGVHMIALGGIAYTAWAAGNLASASIRRDGASVPWGLTVAIGLALLAQALLLLGVVGWLRAPVIVVLVLAILAAARRRWMWPTRQSRSISAMAMAAIALLMLPAFILALYPPLGFDQTMYHLPYARAFAATGGLPFLPSLRYPTFPALAEVLNAGVLLFADDVATQLTGVCALAACAALVFSWTRERSSADGGRLAAAILAASPLAIYLSAAGYVEPLLALFGTASLYAADRAGRDGRHAGWIVASGALAGSAAGVKYLGLYFVAAAALLLLRTNVAWRSIARDLVLYGLAAASALLPSYGRLVAQTGNPLFPFYPELFGATPWMAQEFLGARGAQRLLNASTLLWDVTFRRHAVGILPPFSPALLLGVPLALIAAWQDAWVLRLLLVATGYVLVAPVQAHYFLAIAPVWSVVIGVSAASLASRVRGGRLLLLGVALALVIGGELYALGRVHRLGLPPVAMADRERWVAAERPLYPALAFVNRLAGPAIVYAVGAEHMVYYAAGTLLGDHNGPASFNRVAARAQAAGSLASALDDLHVSYLILPVAPSAWTDMAVNDPRLARVYRDAAASVYQVLPEEAP